MKVEGRWVGRSEKARAGRNENGSEWEDVSGEGERW